MEQRQLTTAHGLRALLGFLAVVAVRLLQLRSLSRRQLTTLTQEVVPPVMLRIVEACLGAKSSITIQMFWHAVARLGGFLGRQRDGNPGWQTLWRGWHRLQDMYWGASIALARVKCG